MNMNGKQSNSEQVKLSGRLSEFRDALQEEIETIKGNGQNSTLLVGGHSIEAKGSGFWYRFIVEYMPSLPADTPCKLTIGTDQYDVTVISSSDNEIIVASVKKLPANIGKAKLENGSTILMERLIKCIEDNADIANPAGERMFPGSDGQVYKVKNLFTFKDKFEENLNKGQRHAVKSSVENDITYIWGPPGTGKTTVIATIINELYDHNRTVLIVSHTNTAVDGAIAKCHDKNKYKEKKPYPMLRIGTASKEVPEQALLDSHIKQLGEDLFDQKERLEKRQQEILEELNNIRIIQVKDSWQKNSNLPEIKGISQAVEQMKGKVILQKEQIRDARKDLDDISQSYPDSSALLKMDEDLKEKKNSLKVCQDNIVSLKNQIVQIEYQRQNAEDEIKKHTKYKELLSEIQHFMSVQFYKEKISETNKSIETLKDCLDKQIDNMNTLLESVHKYEKKSAIAKLLSRKAVYEHDKNTVIEISQNMEKITEEISRKKSLLADYQKKLNDLLLLQQKKQDLTPTRTIREWTDEEQSLEKSILELKRKLAEKEKHAEAVTSQITILEYEKNRNHVFFEYIEPFQEKIMEWQETVEEAKKHLSRNQETLTTLLNEECEYCTAFHEFQSYEPEEMVGELIKLNEEVREDLCNINIEEVNNRKTSCEEEANQILSELRKH